MRYDDLMILEGMFIDVSSEEVKDVIRAELGANISYCIETFDFENEKIHRKITVHFFVPTHFAYRLVKDK